ncbi:caffeoylshikimate esterase-like isoform X2 [Tripterygium wilfordii]|uniref:caffeoylshikimate esterase-like isoform X2 n=1 Tax=Tripterygium wilfordii TaxID=458696 RepID=UPI0018F85668|nr:caffeoylshikimate esterase-like isoform X2 [Tripterygium wilfordii]
MESQSLFESGSANVVKSLLYDECMDKATQRRRAREAFKEVQCGIDHCLMKIPYEGLKIEEKYEVNSRGLEIFSKSWIPEAARPKAVVCYCHGYGETCTFTFEGIAKKLASSGYAVFAMDYPGFGLSEGLHGYIPSFDSLVNYVVEHFSKVKDFRGLPSFLFGQSMGGAVAVKIHLKQPEAWNGAILVAPMCKLGDAMFPPWFVLQILIVSAHLFPKLKLVQSMNFLEMAVRDVKKRELHAAYNIIAYKDRARLGTALECIKTTQEIEKRLEEVSLPLLILHGKADVITDPSISEALYEKASSWDKKINLYEDAYHCLLDGEPDEMISKVLGDITSWLDDHIALH